MADTAVVTDDSMTSGGESAGESTDSTALTPEQRDAQTFAQYGRNPDGTPKGADDVEEPAKPATPAVPDADADKDAADADTDTSDNDADSDEGTAGDGDADSDDDADPEITDEDVENVVTALEERLVTHPKIAARVKAAVEAETARVLEEQNRTRQTSEETDLIIQRGSKAVTAIYDLFNGVGAELGKAVKGEEFKAEAVDATKLQEHFGEFGAAVVAETRRAFDNGFLESFKVVAKELGVTFSKEDAGAMETIFKTATRIENDPKQGREPAIRHLYSEAWKLLGTRAQEQAKSAALAEVKAQRDAAKKIKGDNAETAAIAKVIKQRKGAPPKPVTAEPTGKTASGDDLSDDAYRAAKAAGDHAEADRIVQQRAMLASR